MKLPVCVDPRYHDAVIFDLDGVSPTPQPSTWRPGPRCSAYSWRSGLRLRERIMRFSRMTTTATSSTEDHAATASQSFCSHVESRCRGEPKPMTATRYMGWLTASSGHSSTYCPRVCRCSTPPSNSCGSWRPPMSAPPCSRRAATATRSCRRRNCRPVSRSCRRRRRPGAWASQQTRSCRPVGSSEAARSATGSLCRRRRRRSRRGGGK